MESTLFCPFLAIGLAYLAILALSGCAATSPHGLDGTQPGGPSSYRSDLDALRAKTDVVELQDGSARVAVTPQLQGRVMTSSFTPGGLSLGWVNRAAMEVGEQDVPFNNYGGQDRVWFGPEGGPFTLYHPKGEPQGYSNWKVPDAMDKGSFVPIEAHPKSIAMRRRMDLRNAEGTEFTLRVDRTVRMIGRADASKLLDVEIPGGTTYVGFETENRIANIGEKALTAEGGTVGIWILSMYPAREHTVVIAPFKPGGWTGPEVNTAYFPKQPGNRIRIDGGSHVLLFRADGRCQSKFGLSPTVARDRIGSIDFENRVLTIVLYDRPEGADRYVNSVMQATQKDPFAGDVVNGYCNGPEGGLCFYEMESSSPAAFLAPTESLSHTHRTLQFQGALDELSHISEKVLGVPLSRARW